MRYIADTRNEKVDPLSDHTADDKATARDTRGPTLTHKDGTRAYRTGAVLKNASVPIR